MTDEVRALADALVEAFRRLEEEYRRLCLMAGNANARVYQVLRDEGPLHFYELILRTGLARSTVHEALLELRALGLVQRNERTDQWSLSSSENRTGDMRFSGKV
jgi:DNA-binding transcriptional ArsR family regulator